MYAYTNTAYRRTDKVNKGSEGVAKGGWQKKWSSERNGGARDLCRPYLLQCFLTVPCLLSSVTSVRHIRLSRPSIMSVRHVCHSGPSVCPSRPSVTPKKFENLHYSFAIVCTPILCANGNPRVEPYFPRRLSVKYRKRTMRDFTYPLCSALPLYTYIYLPPH